MDRLLFLAVVASLPLMQPPLLAIDGYPVVLTDALFLALAAQVAALFLRGRFRVQWSGFHTAIVAFVLASFLSAAFAGTRHAFIKAAGSGYLGALGILASHYAQQRGVTRQIVWAWLGGTTVTMIAVVAGVILFAAGERSNMFLYGYGSLIPGAYPRVQGLFLNANVLYTYLAVGIFFLLGLVHTGVMSVRLGYTWCAVLVVGALFTLSPGLGGLALAASWWLTPALNARTAAWVRVSGIGAAVAFVLSILLSPTMLERGSDLRNAPLQPSSRVMAWRDSIATFVQHPLVGVGPGNDVAHVHYLNASHFQEFLTDAHNTFLSVLGQTGVIGFACFALMLAPMVARIRTTPDLSDAGTWRTACEYALVAALLYPSLSGSFEDTRHVWVLLGLVHAAQQGASGPETTPVVPA